jgi:hypothetical protein
LTIRTPNGKLKFRIIDSWQVHFFGSDSWRVNKMSCDCGERFQRIFDSTNEFAVYFDAQRRTAPLLWKQEGLSVCINCGDITSRVPDAELQELRRGAGGDESVA